MDPVLAYLDYIAESIARIAKYLASDGGPDQRRFYEDSMTQDAVLRRVKTLADAASHVPEGLKARHPEVDWRRIIDLPHVLEHGYVTLDLDLIWRAITNDLPVLKTVIEQERG